MAFPQRQAQQTNAVYTLLETKQAGVPDFPNDIDRAASTRFDTLRFQFDNNSKIAFVRQDDSAGADVAISQQINYATQKGFPFLHDPLNAIINDSQTETLISLESKDAIEDYLDRDLPHINKGFQVIDLKTKDTLDLTPAPNALFKTNLDATYKTPEGAIRPYSQFDYIYERMNEMFNASYRKATDPATAKSKTVFFRKIP